MNAGLPTRIVFWEQAPLFHMEDIVCALSAHAPDVEIVCCADHELTQEHRELGLASRADSGLDTIISPPDRVIEELARTRPSETLHIFFGIYRYHTLLYGMQCVRKSGARLAIMHEPRVREGWKGELRFIQSWLTEGWLRKNARFVLGIGRNGPRWFESVGYPADRVLPCAYFIDLKQSVDPEPLLSTQDASSVRVGYAGRLVPMKGVEDLVHALAMLDGGTSLAIAGGGADEERLRRLCARLAVDVTFNGPLPNDMMGGFMRGLDVLVLASRSNDGWGVVVNEALMSGTAVIATPCVGASLVLSEPSFGLIVPPRSPGSIAEAIRSLAESGAFTPDARSNRERLARTRLSTDAGVKYLLEIIRWSEDGGARPRPFFEAAEKVLSCKEDHGGT